MIIRGASRGNGKQLAQYLQTPAENERVEFFGAWGTSNPDDLTASIIEMDRFAKLTKGSKSIYHAIISPDRDESHKMTDEDWLFCIDTLAKEQGLHGQPWAAQKHLKDGKWHMHTTHQRYSVELGRFISDSHSYKGNDRARATCEIKLGHARTPQRNENRPILTKNVIDAWQKSKTGQEFFDRCKDYGYTVASSTTRRPFMIIDENGRSFDLLKKLRDKPNKFSVRTAQMKERMKDIELPSDKSVIRNIRTQQKARIAKENKELFEDMTERERRKSEFAKKFKPRDHDKDHER
ncbi:relaxase/mobilization nuclease domain-containing protein [Dyadobacter jiangsuensis]|uniref:MobA/VirD2-like nuclease domain-containing protein n=1 Tax=Dyadobacter jiangsuensis TaxID=1591085 RepID=A0A2P8FP37_9BACT|nr:hypothetical protein [Dyadobacter jiangsuensis]PSL23500.1 hypothetical protein CLV60_11655 [Dyadobacter jiangsuensis]